MALHAGFAAALSFTKDTLQSFIHAAYVNNLNPGRLKGKTFYEKTDIVYDFLMAEPRIQLDDDAGEYIKLHFDLLGKFTFTTEGNPAFVTEMHIKFSVHSEIMLVPPKNGGKGVQFGIDAKTSWLAGITMDTIGKTPPPVDIFFADLEAIITIIFAAITKGTPFVITAPQLAHFVAVGYNHLSIKVKITKDSLNIGVDVKNKTVGDASQLVDLNRISIAKGWKKTLNQSVHTYDDEYGEPIYEAQWGQTEKRITGPHNTDVAVSLNEKIFQDIFHRYGRYRIFAFFETKKYERVQKRLIPYAGNFPLKRYEPSDLDLTALDELTIGFRDDYLQINGVGSNYSVIPAHADFALKARFVRTYFAGNTQFIINYAETDGITAETYEAEVSDPDWQIGVIILALSTGINLLPNTAAVSLASSAVLETLVGTVVGNLLGEHQEELALETLNSVSGFHTAITYTMPNTTGPVFAIRCDDIVIRPDSVSAWFVQETKGILPRIYLKSFPANTGTSEIEHARWPVSMIEPIVVLFEEGNFLYNPSGPPARIRWQVHGNQMGNLLFHSDMEINSAANPKQISIDYFSNENVLYTQFHVSCRVYLPWHEETIELFKQELVIKIEDRLDRTHPYVHWNHRVYYKGFSAKLGQPDRKQLGWQIVDRNSHIHYTNPAKRCRFADGFPAGLKPTYLDTLPFPIELANDHRKVICPYCFFGGPDKDVLK